MTARILVLGAGYAGSVVVRQLERTLDPDEAEIIWLSEHGSHLVVHEVHRVIRRPALQDVLTIPVEAIKRPETSFERRSVADVHGQERVVESSNGERLAFDYVVDCLGSKTAFYGIDGMRDHALTLKSLDDALAIHSDTMAAAAASSPDDPATVVVGGAGLSGVQCVGELAALRDGESLPIDIHLVEALDEIFPGHDHQFQGALRQRLDDHDVGVSTGDAIVDVADDRLQFDGGDSLEYDVLVWTGGVTGLGKLDDPEIERERGRTTVADTLQTDDERVFVVGDAAIVDLADGPPPPTAQAAWRAADVAAENVVHALRGQPLTDWTYEDWGTFVSVGDDAVAHGVKSVPLNTFSGPVARTLKRAIAARWVAKISSWRRGIRTWLALRPPASPS
ncbi:MAG: NAD(P)/FAD-dependent oxidoreductase [Halorientalis sp.]